MCLVSKRKTPKLAQYSMYCYKVLRVIKDIEGKIHYYAPFQNVEYTDIDHQTHSITIKANTDCPEVRKEGNFYIVEGQGVHVCNTFDRAIKIASSLERSHFDKDDFVGKRTFVVFIACIPRNTEYWESKRKMAEELAAREVKVNLLYGIKVEMYEE